MGAPTSADLRFWAMVDKSGGPDACWPWRGEIFEKYGRFYPSHGKKVRAHRFAFGLAAANGHVIRHTCDNPPCCNPAHLLCGTQLDNIADRQARNRQARLKGVENGHHILTEDQILEIRRRAALGVARRALSREFLTDRRNIQFIVERRTWRHI
jgi:hypothetical protein